MLDFLLFLRTVLNGVLAPSHGAVFAGGGWVVLSSTPTLQKKPTLRWD